MSVMMTLWKARIWWGCNLPKRTKTPTLWSHYMQNKHCDIWLRHYGLLLKGHYQLFSLGCNLASIQFKGSYYRQLQGEMLFSTPKNHFLLHIINYYYFESIHLDGQLQLLLIKSLNVTLCHRKCTCLFHHSLVVPDPFNHNWMYVTWQLGSKFDHISGFPENILNIHQTKVKLIF